MQNLVRINEGLLIDKSKILFIEEVSEGSSLITLEGNVLLRVNLSVLELEQELDDQVIESRRLLREFLYNSLGEER